MTQVQPSIDLLKSQLEQLTAELDKWKHIALTATAPAAANGSPSQDLATNRLLLSNSELQRQISTLRLALEQLRLLGSAVQSATDGILILTPAVEREGPRIAWVNDAFLRMSGLRREEVIAQTLDSLCFAQEGSAYEKLMQSLFYAIPFRGESRLFDGTERELPVEIEASPIRDGGQVLSHWVVFIRNAGERAERMLALEHQAHHDQVTGLPNRILFFDRLERAVISQPRTLIPVALMVLDLDRFKEVNDELGYQQGDLLLRQVGMRLRGIIRKSDTIARVGGDEFAVLLPQVVDADSAMEVATKLLKTLDTPFILDGRKLPISASLGIAVSPAHATDAASLLRCADMAMYRAKQSRTGLAVYSPDQESGPSGYLELATELRRAIEQSELVLHYQPKVRMKTGVATRAEVLVRWQHPQRGMIYPDQFIPVAEKMRLIRPVTWWVMNAALRQCREWRDKGLPMNVAVNLSPESLQDPSLPDMVVGLVERWNLEPESLKIEITESSLMADPPRAQAVLSLLKTFGVSLSLDDFGTGFSSLTTLRQIPFDEIKIDKSFVMGMEESESDAAIVRATIDLAHNLGRQVVAEGVETREAWMRLLDWGCDMAQGYYLSRPVPADGLVDWLEHSRWGLEFGHPEQNPHIGNA
ncbi:MAG: EAL domain-containing protein [Thermoanaerobaculia bacterium]